MLWQKDSFIYWIIFYVLRTPTLQRIVEKRKSCSTETQYLLHRIWAKTDCLQNCSPLFWNILYKRHFPLHLIVGRSLCTNSYLRISGRIEEAVNQVVQGGYIIWLIFFKFMLKCKLYKQPFMSTSVFIIPITENVWWRLHGWSLHHNSEHHLQIALQRQQIFKIIFKFTANITIRKSRVTTFQERMSVRSKVTLLASA